MIGNDVIEKHRSTEPVPWLSNTVVTPRLLAPCVAIDVKNISKAIESLTGLDKLRAR